MSTCVFYIDEAGTSLPHKIPLLEGQTPIFTLAALSFPLATWRDRDRNYLRLKRHYFPERMGRHKIRDEEIEIKGNEMTAPRNALKSRNHAFLNGVLKYISTFNGVGFGVTFIKNYNKPASARSIYTQGLQILMERFNMFLCEHSEYNNGIIILDSRLAKTICDRHDLEVARSHMSFIFGHSVGKTLNTIMEPPLFNDSRLSVGIQVCDIFASLLFTNHYHYHAGTISGAHNYSHSQNFWTSIKTIEFKSKDTTNPFPYFGFRVIKLGN